MISRWARHWSSWIFHPVICLLIQIRVTPNMLTISGLILALLCGYFIAINSFLVAASFLVLSGLFDSLDGELARQMEKSGTPNSPNRLGPFIDSIADHYGDLAIYLGFVFRAVDQNNPLVIYLTFLSMFGSLMGSHIRSRAGMVGVDTKSVGIFTRMERTLVLLFGLLSGWISLTLAILAIASNISALQRMFYTVFHSE